MENHRSRIAAWLVNTLLAYGKLSLVEIDEKWREAVDLSGGESLTRLQMHRAISSAFDMLGVVVECNRKDGYRYHIAADCNQKATEWLLSSLAVNRSVKDSEHMRDRILFEDVSSGQLHLSTIMSAMKCEKALEMSYQKFADSQPVTSYIEPYCVKFSHQRWYLLACKDHRDHLQVFALDRIKQLRILNDHEFHVPETFSAHQYFEHFYGVHTGNNSVPSTIRLRANQFWTNYLRTLPLHHSQQEVLALPQGAEFEYVMAPTPDLLNQLLSFGPGVEVLQPQELRSQILETVARMYNMYK